MTKDSRGSRIVETMCAFYRARGIEPGDCVAVAFSGGADSVALLAATVAAGYRCVALHCNFHLRGEESDRDERFARGMAARLGCQIRVVHFDVEERRRHTGESVEMACRSLRYEWFGHEFACADGAWRCVAVAHHADDSVETFLLNLVRGTGLRGLRGIVPERGIFLRPLLGVSRSDIMAFLSSENLGYVVDSSNLSNDYRRNLLRNKVIPALEADFPSIRKAITVTAANIGRDMELLHSFVERSACRLVDAAGCIDLDAVAAEPCSAELLYHLLNRGEGVYGIEAARSVLTQRRSGAAYMSENGRGGYLIDRGMLVPLPEVPEGQDAYAADSVTDLSESLSAVGEGGRLRFPAGLEAEMTDIAHFAPERDPKVLWLDAEALKDAVAKGDRLVLRPWREGDRMSPFGMKGSRLVSDIFSDAKVSLSARRAARLLVCGERILWVPGVRASRHFAVTDLTKKVLKMMLMR